MISVCIATYNGEKYLKEQLDSIIPQLSLGDEVIISDDGSTDSTLEILKQYEEKNEIVKVLSGPREGVIANFNFVISQSRGDIIFLADQDDVWTSEKVTTIKAFFSKHPATDLVVSDLVIMNENLEPISDSYFAYRNVGTGFLKNLLKSGYIGAGMAFRSSMKKKILPIPAKVPMHDMWIGLIGDSQKKVALLPQKLTFYRRHENNASEIATQASFFQQFKWRVDICLLLFKRLILKL